MKRRTLEPREFRLLVCSSRVEALSSLNLLYDPSELLGRFRQVPLFELFNP